MKYEENMKLSHDVQTHTHTKNRISLILLLEDKKYHIIMREIYYAFYLLFNTI